MKRFLKTVLCMAFGALFWTEGHAQSSYKEINYKWQPPKHEVRAVWLATIGGIDWPHSYAQNDRSTTRQKQELCDMLDRLQRANVNTVLLQTRIRGTLIYPSHIEPWDGCLSGTPGRSPGYDALQFAIDECHRRGMEVQAWVVSIPVGKWNATGCRQLRQRHPSLIRKVGAEGYMDPGQAGTASYLADLCEEIVRNYDVDGIHLDYIRYPETWELKKPRAQARQDITRIVSTISQRVKAIKPWVKMSCAPIGKHDDLPRQSSRGWNAYSKVCQDAQGWLRDGLMDELFPMMYFRNNQFYPFAFDWAEHSYGRIVAPGLGIYFLSPDEQDWPLVDITREMEVLRQNGMGHAYFRSMFFIGDTKGIYHFARETFDQYPALIPPMRWACNDKPAPPRDLSIQHGSTSDLLSWNTPPAGNAPKGCHAAYYNVYASRSFPVDTHDARNLIATRLIQTRLTLPPHLPIYYAVTSMNRYGMESTATQLTDITSSSALSSLSLLSCNGENLHLPSSIQQIDNHLFAIETLQGSIIATCKAQGSSIHVGRLAEGIYILRSLQRKGSGHRLGFFIVKRTHQ